MVAGREPQVYAEGFTNIIDLALGKDGSLYVLEIATNGLTRTNRWRADPHRARWRAHNDCERRPGHADRSRGWADGATLRRELRRDAGQGEVVRIKP